MEKQTSRTKRQREIERSRKLNKMKFRTAICDDFNRDVLRCRCGAILKYADSYNPLEGISNDRGYRQKCINDMRKMWIQRKRSLERSAQNRYVSLGKLDNRLDVPGNPIMNVHSTSEITNQSASNRRNLLCSL